ncbi:MAG: GtrA family protein [Methanobrevibacter sp.]|jgi:putative flippase GtrA|nr:GtrA family protein [Candidatus Methanoflexus mossambicus]
MLKIKKLFSNRKRKFSKLRSNLLNQEIILYLIFGVLTTGVNILTYFFLAKIIGLNYLISNILAWFVSVVFAYITNRKWVFKSIKKNIIKEFSLFVGGRLFSGIIDSVLMVLFIDIFLFNDLISKIIINIIVIIINYIFSKIIVFKKN